MHTQQNQQQRSKRQASISTPINYVYKPIEKTTAPKVIFPSLKTEQQQFVGTQSRKSHNESYNLSHSNNVSEKMTPSNIKHSHYIQQLPEYHQKSQLQQKMAFLQHCLNQYKLQAMSAYSKLNQRQKYFKQAKEKYDTEISTYKSQVQSLEQQLQGQGKLIEQCYEKYDSEVKQHQLCMKVIHEQKLLIQDLNSQISPLERAVNSTRQVSVNLIKQNQDLKAQIMIEREKYSGLFVDYEQLMTRYEKGIRELSDQNRSLMRKMEQLDTEIKIYEKDKEIEKLLIYEDSIEKRQKQIFSQDTAHSPSLRTSLIPPNNSSPYNYLPRRLNFDDQTARTNKRIYAQNQVEQDTSLLEIVELQKKAQVKQLEKRNKELQGLMVKFMK